MEDLKTLKTSIGLQLQRFLDKPDIKREERELPFRSFMHLLLLDLAFAGLLTAFLHLLGIDKSAYHRFDMELFKKLPILFFIGGVIVAPFFEEYLFRYFLDYRTKTLTIFRQSCCFWYLSWPLIGVAPLTMPSTSLAFRLY